MKQRTIKFRAWQNGMTTQENSGVYGTKKFLDTLYEDCILMQYTGLKDKNGVEIYEGDIVIDIAYKYNKKTKKWDIPKKYEIAHEVVWGEITCEDSGMGGSHNRYYEGWMLDSGMPVRSNKSAEVIGNIYENKNLLK